MKIWNPNKDNDGYSSIYCITCASGMLICATYQILVVISEDDFRYVVISRVCVECFRNVQFKEKVK